MPWLLFMHTIFNFHNFYTHTFQLQQCTTTVSLMISGLFLITCASGFPLTFQRKIVLKTLPQILFISLSGCKRIILKTSEMPINYTICNRHYYISLQPNSPGCVTFCRANLEWTEHPFCHHTANFL